MSLLPRYVAGRLGDRDREAVETHLSECPACRATQQQLADRAARTAADPEHRRLAPRPKLGSSLRRLSLRAGATPLATAAQVAAVALALALVLPHAPHAAHRQPQANILVTFRPNASDQALVNALRVSGAQVVGGPTATDAFLLHAEPARRDAAVAVLRVQPAIALAQPISPSQGGEP